MDGLSSREVERFVVDGFVHVEGAFPREVADACRALLWAETGCDPDDPATWTRPVVRIDGMGGGPFEAAANTLRLRAAFDQLAGPGRWRPRTGLGSFPIRFPHADDPGDAGWHVEASYAVTDPGTTHPPRTQCGAAPPRRIRPAGEWRLNLRSRGRALLMLFLFSDVGPDDAPTRIRVGSHLDVAPLLAPYGDAGAEFFAFCAEAVPATAHRPVALATGAAGDVYLVHPFLVHAAQRHRGSRPRFIAQPPLDPTGELDLDAATTPVERAVRLALDAARARRPAEESAR